MITLFQHQQQALDETEGKNRVAYYLDMGLGKTFVGSEKMMKLDKRINLVVCQCSKVQDWIEHFQDHYTRNCVFDLTNPKTFKWFFEQVQHEVPTLMIGVINYELTFRRNVLKTLTGFTLMLDESSLIQNENAKRSKFILGLKPDNVILLSGTPTGGKYENLWSQCQLLGWKISKELFWKQYIQTEWVETDGFWRKQITGYKNVDRLKMKLAEHGAVFMTTEQAGISLPKRNWIKVKTRPSPLYWKFWNDRYVAIDSANLGEFELDADFYGSNAHCERELIGDTSLTRRLYARQLCGLYNPARYMRRWANDAAAAYKAALDSNSPSKRFMRIGEDTVLGYNLGIANLGGTTKGVVTDWANSFTSVNPTMSFAVDTSALKYYSSDSFAQSVSADVAAHSTVTATGFKEGMEEFYREYIEPTLSQMADDMRRQADKQEQTVVQIGNRVVNDAVTTQKKANGYVFAR